MSKIRFLRMGQMQSVGTGGNTTATMRFPIGPAYLGLIFLLANTTTNAPADWSGSDIIRTMFNARISTQTTMNRLGAVQDARQLGPIRTTAVSGSGNAIFDAQNSISWPLIGGLTGDPDAPARKPAFFLNFGQESAASVLSRRFLALNTGAPGFETFDVEIQLGSYTTPQITVIAVIDDDLAPGQQTEVVSIVREKTWDLQSSGEKVFTDLPAYDYRSITFDNLNGLEEGFGITLNNLERVNTIDNGIAKNRSVAAAAIQAIFGIQGNAIAARDGTGLTGNQAVIFDAGGNADSLLQVRNNDNIQLRFQVAAAKTVTGLLEIVGNPLTA